MFSLRKAAAAAAILITAAAWSSPAFADDFMDTRITFLFSDNNVFAGPADYSPQPDFTQRQAVNYFFDNYNTRDTGQETKTDLAVYKRMTGWHPRLETEAAFLIRFDLYADPITGQGSQEFEDDGTYIQVNWLMGELSPDSKPGRPPRFYFLGFPFNADRIRLGYSYGISWGGREIFPQNTSPVPGAKFGWDGDRSYAYGVVKTHRELNANTNNIETEYAFMGGAGYDVTPIFRVEGAGGYFQKGALPPVGPGDPLAGQRINASGVSGQITFHKGLPIIESVDVQLYRNDPDLPFTAFKHEVYAPGISWLASSEFSLVDQNLRNPDTFGSTENQLAYAGDINLKLKVNYTRLYADFVYRSLSFILMNVPSFTPYYAFSHNAIIHDQKWVDFGIDHYFPQYHQTPGVVLGYEIPASYSGDTTNAGLVGINTVVVDQQGTFTILPTNQSAANVISTRIYDRVDLSDMLALIGQVQYQLDKNQTELVESANGIPVRVFKSANVQNELGFAVILQARY